MPPVPTRDRRQFQKAGSQPAPVPDDPPEVAAPAPVAEEPDALPEPLEPVESAPLPKVYSRPVSPAVAEGPRLSDDPNERAQQSMAGAEAGFEAKQRAVNPFLYSGAVKSLAKIGGRKYMDKAVQEGERAYATQVQNDRAQAIATRRGEQDRIKAENADREAQFRSTGQQFYTDPYGRIQPIKDPQGRVLYHATTWEEGAHPKTGLPVLQKRDQFGQRQFKTPPIVASPDLTDDQLYYKFGDDDLRPAGKVEDLVNHPDFNIARTAKRAASARKTAIWKEAIAPMEAVKADTEVAYEQGQQRAIELQAQIEQLSTQAASITPEILGQTEGGIMGIGAKPTPVAAQAQQQKAMIDTQIGALLTEQAQLTDSLNPMGQLGRTKRTAALDLAIFKAKAAHESYTDLADERRLILRQQGKSEEDDPTLKSIVEAQETYGTQLKRAASLSEREALDASRASRATPETAPAPAAPAEEIGTVGGIVNVAERAARTSLAGMDILGAVARGGKESDYNTQAEKLEQQAANIDQLQPGWSPENRAAWADRAIKTAAQLRERAVAMGQSKQEQLVGAAGQMQEASKIKGAPAYENYSNARGSEAVRRFFENPFEVATNIATEGALGSIPTLAAGTAGGVTAGIPGAAAGAGLGSFATEYASTLMDTFSSAGVDTSNPEALMKAFGDDRLMTVARRRGLARGIPVAIFDALSGGLAGRSVAPVVKSGLKQILKAGGKEVIEQGALGMAGETAGQVSDQLAETGSVDVSKLNFKDIFAEGIGEIVPGAAQVATGAVLRTPKTAVETKPAAEATATAPAKEDAAATPSRNFPTTDAAVEQPTTRKLTPDQQAAEDELQRRLAASDLNAEERAEFDRLRNESEPEGPISPTPGPSTAEQAAEVFEPSLAEKRNTPPPAKSAADSAATFQEAAATEEATADELSRKEGTIQRLVDQISGGNDQLREGLLSRRKGLTEDQFIEALQGVLFRQNPGRADVAKGVSDEASRIANAPIDGETAGVENVGRIVPKELEAISDVRETDRAQKVGRAMAEAGGDEAYRPDTPEPEVVLRDETPQPAAESARTIETELEKQERLRRSEVGSNKLALDLQRQAAISNDKTVPQSVTDKPARAAPEVQERQPEQPAPDVPARKEVAPAKPVVADERAEYDRLQARMKELGPEKFSTPEYQEAWRQSEAIKNRNKGMPPGEVSGEAAPSKNPTKAPAPVSAAVTESTPESVEGDKINKNWTAFDKASGTLGIPRSEMPQIKSEARGALVNFLKARGIDAKAGMISPSKLKPTQAEFSPEKVQAAREHTGSERPLLISSDNHVVDGHHQWMAALDDTSTPMGVIRLAAPIDRVLAEMKEFPSTETAAGSKPKVGTKTQASAGPAAPKLSDRAIEALQKAKIDTKGKLFDVTGAVAATAYNAALDIAILGIRAGRALADVIKLAVARYKAKHPQATAEEVSKLTKAIQDAHANPPEPAGPKTAKSAVPESLREGDVPAQDIEYEVRNQDERMKEARAMVDKDGATTSEQKLSDRKLPADTRVAIGGILLEKKMGQLADAKPEEVARLTSDINRITAAIRSGVSTESGQGVAMHNRIYQNLGVMSAMEYTREVNKKRVEQMGGEDASKAAGEAAEIFNKTKDQAARDKAIEKLKERYTSKPVVKMLNSLQGLEVAQKLNDLGVLRRDDMIEIAGNELGLPGVESKKLRQIADLVDRIEGAKNLADAEAAQLELADTLANFRGTSKIDLETSLMTLNVLFSSNTQLANAGGNAFRLVTELASVAGSNPTMARQKALWEGFKGGLPIGWDQAKSIWETGRSTRDLQDKTIGVGSAVERADYRELYPNMPKAIANALNVKKEVLARVGRFMRAMDALAYYPAREAYARMAVTKLFEKGLNGDALEKKVSEILHTTPAEIAQAKKQAESEGYTGIASARRASEIIEAKRSLTKEGETAAKESESFAADTTYTNEPVGNAGIIYRAASNVANRVRIGDVPVLKPWMMFLRTPTNMFNASLDYTPVGAARALKGSIVDQSGARREFTQDEINRKYFQASVGTALMAGTTLAIAKGLMDVTFKGPQDPEKRRQLMTSGWRPFSFRIGNGPYMSYRDTPMIVPLAVVGYVADAAKYNKDKKDQFLESRVADALLNAPFQAAFATSPLTGMADLLGAANGQGSLARGLTSVPSNLVIPGSRLLMELDRYLDPKTYDSNPLKQTVPFLRREGVERSDVEGRPVEVRPSDRFVGFPTNDPLDRMLNTRGLTIPGVGLELKLGKQFQDRAMTDAEKEAYKRVSGQRIRARLQAIMPRLSALPTEDAQDEIQRITREERARVKPLIGVTIKK